MGEEVVAVSSNRLKPLLWISENSIAQPHAFNHFSLQNTFPVSTAQILRELKGCLGTVLRHVV